MSTRDEKRELQGTYMVYPVYISFTRQIFLSKLDLLT